uniref:uncharacterized protein LOC117611072 n=1 Tax=Osmia lignaria TaxID=473952 RepID=UPI001478EDE8|nr:uncharacterized protein LOC117611072 [Osmia lignaria]
MKWEAVVLIETWLEERGWKNMRDRLPKGYRWEVQLARRRNKKGRAMGGMLMGIKEEMLGKEGGFKKEAEREGILVAECKGGKEKWRVVGVNVNGDTEAKIEELNPWLEEVEREGRTIIGGDFNARTGEEGGAQEKEEEDEGEERRRSKDKKINGEGKRLLEVLRETGWSIVNGSIEGNEEGEFTSTGARGDTVIDYVIAEAEGRERIVSMKVGDSVDSDHHPVIMKLRAGGKQMTKVEKEKRATARGNWTEQGRKKFREELKWRRSRDGKVDEDMEIMIEEFKRGLEKSREKGQINRKKGWWDEECEERIEGLKGVLREWRKGREEGESYRKAKREYNSLCKDKKREENERFIKEVEGAKTDKGV